jgi:anti-sigma regulatory factor (Ser/Thr protein kinase)
MLMAPSSPFFVRAFRAPVTPARLRSVRDGLLQEALARGVPEPKAWDLFAAADELLCNIEEHSNARWMEISAEQGDDGEAVLRIVDDGRDFDVSKASIKAPGPSGWRERHLGLWMVARLARAMESRRSPEGGNEILIRF